MSEELTFNKICGPASPKADVVFVHGLTGDPNDTWTSYDGKEYWPTWLCADFVDVAVYAIGYPASLFEKWAKKEMDLFERAANVLEFMAAKSIGDRPLIFITHSLGGILTKQIIRQSCDTDDGGWKKICEQTKLVIFLATPHNGAALAGALKTALPHFAAKHIDLLSNDSGILTDINNQYRVFANGQDDLKTVAYFEKYKTKAAVLVVSKESSDPGVAGCQPVPVDRDHISICKPRDREDIIYASIARHLKNLLEKLPTHSGISFGHDSYGDKSDGDRRDLLTKLIAACKEHEYPRANDLQNKFAQNYLKLGLYTPAKEDNDKLLSEVEQRFLTHVYHPLICKNASEDEIRQAIQQQVIDPICQKRASQKGFGESTVLKALYFLTEQCHIRWDAET